MYGPIWNRRDGQQLGWVQGGHVYNSKMKPFALERDGKLYCLDGKPLNRWPNQD